MDCSEITNTALNGGDCTSSAVSGTGERVLQINYDDVDRALSTVADGVITNLVLKAGKFAKPITTLPDSAVGSCELKDGTYKKSHVHKVALNMFVKNEPVKKHVNLSTNSRTIIIIENRENGTAGDVKFEAYGYSAGLKQSVSTNITKLADGVVYAMEYSTPDDSIEGTIQNSIFKTSLTVTEEMIEALIDDGN